MRALYHRRWRALLNSLARLRDAPRPVPLAREEPPELGWLWSAIRAAVHARQKRTAVGDPRPTLPLVIRDRPGAFAVVSSTLDAAMIGPFSASAAYTALTQDIVSSQNDKETTDLSAFTP
jgi:hypothetical protein